MQRAVVGLVLALMACNGGSNKPTTNGTAAGTPAGTAGGTAASPPRAEDDLVSVDEGAAVTIDVAGNDLVTTNPLALGSVTIIDPPAYGGITVNVDGTVEYVHDGSEEPDDTFTYSIEDDQGLASNVATVQIAVTPINDVPIAVNDAGAVDQNLSVVIDLAANDLDPDDGLDLGSVAITVQPLYATLTVNGDGTVEYDHDGTGVATDEFRYTIEDNSGAVSNEAVVSLAVATSNSPPIAVDDFLFLSEGGTANLLAVYNDVDVDDGIDLGTLTVVTPANNGTVTALPDGSFDYVHDGSETTADAFSYTVSDYSGAPSNVALITVGISPVNDPPTANDDAAGVDENQLVNIDVLANDVDPDDGLDTGSVTPVVQPQYGALVVNGDGTIDYTHDGSQVTADSFTYTVADFTGATAAEATVDVTINLINDPPVVADDNAAVDEGGYTVIDLAANDLDTDDGIDLSSLVITSAAVAGAVVDNGDGTVGYTHDGSESSTDSFAYTFDDLGGGTSNVGNVLISVNPVNDPPVAAGDGYTVDEGSGPNPLAVLTNDSDADDGLDPTSIAIVSLPSNGVATPTLTGTVNYTHDGSNTTSDSFTYRVSDFAGAPSNTVTVNLTVTPVNDPPVASNDGYSVDEGSTGNVFAVLGNDSDSDDGLDTGSLVIVGAPSVGTAFVNGSSIEYAHDGSETTSDQLTYQVYDLSGAPSNLATVNITVTPVNDPPIGVADNLSADEGVLTPLDVLANDTDPDDGIDPSTLAVVSPPVNGVALASGGQILYTHDGSETLSDSFSYTVADVSGAVSNVVVVSLGINPVNDAPIAVNDNFGVDEGSSGNALTVLDNDSDADDGLDVGSQVVVSGPSNGTAVVSGNTFSYTHDGSETTSDSFTYTVLDNSGTQSNVATVNITVNPVNDPPVANDDLGNAVDQGLAVNIAVWLNDSDVDNALDVGSIAIVNPPANGTAIPLGDGSIDYAHDNSNTTSDSFTYTIRDVSGALSNVAIVEISINPTAAAGGLYAVRVSDDVLVHIDPDTLAFTDIGPLGVNMDFGELAWDPTTQTLYMVDGRGPQSLYTVDVTTGAATLVGFHGVVDMCALEVDGSGTLWAADRNNTIYTMDRTTGAATPTGAVASVGSWVSLAYDTTRANMYGVYFVGEIHDIDMPTGTMTSLGNPSPIYINNNGATYDPVRDRVWTVGYSGNVTYFDMQAGYLQTEVLTGISAHDGLAFVPDGETLVGQFTVSDGPSWTISPPTYTCKEACALLFGGSAASYSCSTDPAAVNNLAHTDGYGVAGCPIEADDYKVGAIYDTPGNVSAYVMDHGCAGVNYCFQ